MKKKSFVVVLLMLMLISVFLKTGEVNAISPADLFENFSSDSYILIDADSNSVLYGVNPEQKMPVASICKLMTTLLTLEKIESGAISLDDTFVASEYACDAEGSQAFLDAGSSYSVRDLLKSVIVASANDSAIVLAENLAGNEDNFVKLMNERANKLGMKNTHYSNSTGLPKADQYSTAYDTAKIIKEISKYQLYKDDCAIWMDTLVHPSGRETELVNTNRLIKYYSPCVCGKTGFTDEAGYCLSAMAQKNGMNLIAVVLKCDEAPQRFKECMELFNYGFANFENKKVISANELLDFELAVKGGNVSSVKLIAEDDFYIVKKIAENDDIEIRYELGSNAKAPINAGDKVGEIVVLKKGVLLGKVNIVVAEDVLKQSYGDALRKIFDGWEM